MLLISLVAVAVDVDNSGCDGLDFKAILTVFSMGGDEDEMIDVWVVVEEVVEDEQLPAVEGEFSCLCIEESDDNGFSSNAKRCVALLLIVEVLRVVLVATTERDRIGISSI